ncbi:T9SS type A sorting domain-containing protein [Flavobacterium hauense]
MKKILLSAGLLCFSLAAMAQDCSVPVGTLNQSFSTFDQQSFPQKCWTASHVHPNIYVNNADAGTLRNVSFYSGDTPNTPFYLVTPELSTIDGIHALSFDAFAPPGAPGTVTIQVGTLTDAADYTTFANVGEVITLGAASTPYTNILIPTSETAKFIAFKVIATGAHNVAKLDNVKWKGVPATCTVLETLNENFSNFTDDDLTLNCWSKNAGVPMFFISQEEDNDNKYANFYSFTSPNVDGYVVTPELSTIDGNHQLTFDAGMDAGTAEGSSATIQVGTLTIANDYSTFVAVGDLITLGENQSYTRQIAASETAKYIAFRFSGTLEHTAAMLDNVVWDVTPTVCAAQETLNEDFTDFVMTTTSADAFPQNCWNAYGAAPAGPWLYTAQTTDASNQYAVYYTHMGGANVPGYFVTPELSTIDGNHTLSFDAYKLGFNGSVPPGNVTVQVGTLTDPADLTTFEAVGTAITLTGTVETHGNIAIPASATQKYVAFKFLSDSATSAAALDNVKWSETVTGIEDLNKTSFSIYPNPTADRNVTISHNLEANGTVNIYTLTGAKVFSGELNQGSQNLNLSALSAGMYIVKIESGNYSESKKLIVQ